MILESKTKEISLKDFVISVKKWLEYLVSKWVLILLFGIFGAVIGVSYAWLKSPIYVASCNFVLEEGSGGGLGQYAGLASMVGIDVGGNSNNGIFQGDNIVELYKSRTMIVKTLLSTGNFNGQKQLFVDRYIYFNKLAEKLDQNPKLRGQVFKTNVTLTLQQDSLLNEIVKAINKENLFVGKPDKKLSIFNVEVRSKDELFSKQFNDQIVKNVNDFYVQTKTKKSLENLRVLQHQTDSIRGALNGAISSVAISIDANPNANPSRQILRVPSQRRQIDAEANKAILTELVKNLEISKVSLRKETPLIQIIDQPVLPLNTVKPGRFFGLILGGILGVIIIVVILTLRRLYIRLINED